MLADLVLKIRQAKKWCGDNDFPSNKLTRELRVAQFFEHMGQMVPNVHRSSNELCDSIVGCIMTLKLKKVLEIGTLFGYSTLHLAEAAAMVGGHVVTVDLRVSERKWQNGEVVKDIHLAAEKNIQNAGFGKVVTFMARSEERRVGKECRL